MKLSLPSLRLKKEIDLGGGESIGMEAAYVPPDNSPQPPLGVRGGAEGGSVTLEINGKGNWDTARFWKKLWRKIKRR